MKWSIVYIEGHRFYCTKILIFVLANSTDPDEMPHYVAFHLGLHCLPKYPLMSLWSTMGLMVAPMINSVKI